jgi:ADP-ribose pyrophosphatase YjhB (NUDIX family)
MQLHQVFVHYPRREAPDDAFRFCPVCQAALAVAEVSHRPRRVCPRCGYVHFTNPAPVITLLIVRGTEVLLGRRAADPCRGLWALPSGYIEYDDDFLTTAAREAKEETGLEVAIRSILNVHSSFVSPRHHFLGIYLLADVVGGTLAAGDDLEAVDWFPLAGPFPKLAFAEDAELLAACARGAVAGLRIDEAAARIAVGGAQPVRDSESRRKRSGRML